jgi:hypothetical protein
VSKISSAVFSRYAWSILPEITGGEQEKVMPANDLLETLGYGIVLGQAGCCQPG